MAKVFSADIPAPEFSSEDYRNGGYVQKMQAYEREISSQARYTFPEDELAGEVVRFGVADGKASYVVWRSKPLELIYLDYEYSLPEYAERGLTLKDIRGVVEFERKWAELVAKQKKGDTI